MDQRSLLTIANPATRGAILAVVSAWLVTGSARSATADEKKLASQSPVTPAQTPEHKWSEALQQILSEAVPQRQTNSRHWGKTATVPAGITITPRGQIRGQTRRVNHGLWKRYVIDWVDPQRNLFVTVRGIDSTINGTLISLTVEARARCRATVVQWVYGVPVFATTVDADATVQATTKIQLKMKLIPPTAGFLPGMELESQVQEMKLRLQNLDLHQINQIRGKLARELGDSLREVVEDVIQKQEPNVQSRFQKELDKAGRKLAGLAGNTGHKPQQPTPESKTVAPPLEIRQDSGPDLP